MLALLLSVTYSITDTMQSQNLCHFSAKILCIVSKAWQIYFLLVASLSLNVLGCFCAVLTFARKQLKRM